MIYDRKTGLTAQEKLYEDRAMQFLYNSTLGGICVLFLRLPIVSKLYGLFQKSGRSRKKIHRLIKEYDVEPGSAEGNYRSFNDFVTREHPQAAFDKTESHLIAPADSCLRAYTVRDDVVLSVKGKNYTLTRFLRDKALADEYCGGVFLVFRLRVYDYHRYCHVDDGEVLSRRRVRGFTDSVNLSATGRFTLSSNCREIFTMQTKNFGKIVFAEVGAMLVGRIVQTHTGTVFKKGAEKGYFEFGGSSIVLILKKDAVKIDDDILSCSAKGIETKVGRGERIGERLA